MWPVTSTVEYFASIIACQSVYISAVFFALYPLYYCKLAIAWQEGMPAYRQMEDDALKPILVDKCEQI